MTLSILLSARIATDMYAVYISHMINETIAMPPTESAFDLLFVVPNRTISNALLGEVNNDERIELSQTIFLPPTVHRGNGTYIIGVRLISEYYLIHEHSSLANVHENRCIDTNEPDRLQFFLFHHYVCVQMSILG
jgi:hypothetical protein